MSFCGVTVTANKLANLPIMKKSGSNRLAWDWMTAATLFT